MKGFRIVLMMIVAGSACSGNSLLNPHGHAVVREGISFGECGGYCRREVEISSTQAVYTLSSWGDDAYPTKKISKNITANEWEKLIRTIDLETLKGMDDVYGCPDCADGGAEWIEVQSDGFHKKVTFEYGGTLSQVSDFILEARTIRQRFEINSP